MSEIKYSKKQRGLHTEKMTKNQILIYSGGVSQSRGQAAELQQTVHRQCTFAPASMCPDSESPTLGVLLTSPPPFKNPAWPERKRIARVEKTF
jgi:hypothetical protein